MRAVLSTRRMVLRRFEPRDLPALIALDADPEVTRWVDGGAPVDPAAEERMLRAWFAEYDDGDDFGCWAAEGRDGSFLGWFHLRRDADGVPELGYRLRRQVWGLGLATEGSRALIERAFATPGVERVRAETMAVHTASRRVMEKCGMRLRRTFRADWPVELPGSEHGDVDYAITRQEWLAITSEEWLH